MEIVVNFTPQETHALFLSLEEYFRLYPYNYIRLERVTETTQRICITHTTTSALSISLDYFKPIPCPPRLFVTSEGQIKLRFSFNKIQEAVVPKPIEFEEAWGTLRHHCCPHSDHRHSQC